MNKADRVYRLIRRENPRADITVSDLLDLCEYLHRESPKAIAVRVLDHLNSVHMRRAA